MDPSLLRQHLELFFASDEANCLDLSHVDPEIPHLTTRYVFSSLFESELSTSIDSEPGEVEGERDTSEDGSFEGIPKRPFVDVLCAALLSWESTGAVAVFSEQIPLLVEDATFVPDHLVGVCEPLLRQYGASQTPEHLNLFLASLQVRGILSLLGMRKTVGSVSFFPPSGSELVQSFSVLYKKDPVLTVGAVALTKHCVRSSDSFWGGEISGNTLAKTLRADAMHRRILNEAVWMNVHILPGKQVCLEIRVAEGYGSRYVYDDFEEDRTSAQVEHKVIKSNHVVFRGFLEPPMADGHLKKWRH